MRDRGIYNKMNLRLTKKRVTGATIRSLLPVTTPATIPKRFVFCYRARYRLSVRRQYDSRKYSRQSGQLHLYDSLFRARLRLRCGG